MPVMWLRHVEIDFNLISHGICPARNFKGGHIDPTIFEALCEPNYVPCMECFLAQVVGIRVIEWQRR